MVVAIVALWALIYVPGMFSPPLLDDADAGHAEAAREMLDRHDFVTMYVDGVRYLDKAPLPYWLNAASHALFGINEFAVRLPMSLAALALFVSVFFLGRDLAGENAGFFCGPHSRHGDRPVHLHAFLYPGHHGLLVANSDRPSFRSNAQRPAAAPLVLAHRSCYGLECPHQGPYRRCFSCVNFCWL